MPSTKKRSRKAAPLHILSIDVGGTGLKAAIVDLDGRLLTDRVRIPTPSPSPPAVMLDAIATLVAALPVHHRIAAGFPGVVRNGRVITAPHFGTKRWAGFEFAESLSHRLGGACRLLNDAEMQGLAAIQGNGLELMLTLGTGAGTGLFRDGEIMPHMELAHHPVHNDKTYDEYVGDKEMKRIGKKHWNRRIAKVIDILSALLNFDHMFIGGGNSRHIAFRLPKSVTLVPNDAGIEGGGMLWQRIVRAG